MKLITFISAGSFIFLSAFIMKKKNQPDTNLFTHGWSLTTMYTETGKKDVAGKAYIRFNKEKNSAGGNGGCNSFGSSIVTEGNTIRISGIFSTKMYCEGVQENENTFFNLLVRINHYTLEGDNLQLFEGKTLLLVLKKQPATTP